MNRILIYEKWMSIKKVFKKNKFVFKMARFFKYRIFRKIHILILKRKYTVSRFWKNKIQSLNGENDLYLKSLKNSHKGETAFIIGNGPSLNCDDLELLYQNKVFCFGSNRINKIFGQTHWRPNCYLALDRSLCNNNDNTLNNIIKEDDFIQYYAFNKALYNRVSESQKNHKMFYCNILPCDYYLKEEIFGEDPQLYFGNGFTVTYYAIQLAAYMGFTKLYLLGVDCNYSNVQLKTGEIKKDSTITTYFSPKYDEQNKNSAYIDGMLLAYRKAYEYSLQHNIKIYNASASSKLNIFDKVNFRDIVIGDL